ncbi:hypothetical protein Golomagni_01957 [Golovinomyces magnicellulatus]|nr:hypothetical protein Golomagni_01957 [Golovinomyces magnicellulatus]
MIRRITRSKSISILSFRNLKNMATINTLRKRIIFSTISNQCMLMVIQRPISHTSFCGKKKMPDRPPPIDEDEFTEVFLKGSGPGGQKINKTSSAVQLRHKPTGIVLKVQETRSREQNRKIAREKLALKVEMIQKGNESRLAVINATKSKRKASALKKSKRKYRMLEEQKEANNKVEKNFYDSEKEGRLD